MSRLSPRRNQRSKGFKVKHALQICLLIGVCGWLLYQVKHSHDKKAAYEKSVKTENDVIKLGRKDLQPEVKENFIGDERHKEEEEEESKSEEESKPDDNTGTEGGDDEIHDHFHDKTEEGAERREDSIDGEKEAEDKTEEGVEHREDSVDGEKEREARNENVSEGMEREGTRDNVNDDRDKGEIRENASEYKETEESKRSDGEDKENVEGKEMEIEESKESESINRETEERKENEESKESESEHRESEERKENEESKESESEHRESEDSKENEERKESESEHRETEDSKEHEESKETANENKENASEEKERAEESQQKEIKEVVEQSNEEENKEKELESKVTMEDQVNDGNNAHSEEAREEHYKGDDASSAVVHQTQNDTPEEEQGDLKKSGEGEPVENKEKNQLEFENRTNNTEVVDFNQNEVPKVKESDSGENDDSTNAKTSEEGSNENNKQDSEDGSHDTSTVATANEQQHDFGFFRQRNGYSIGVFLSGISPKTAVWAARRDDAPAPSNATLLFTSDGRLVLTSAQGGETLIVSASQPASLASMSDSGNFVLYNSDREIIWQSFDHPTDTLLPTQQLKAGAELFSPVSQTDLSTGIYRLKMQNDGNLVQYPVNTPDTAPYSYFSSGTYGAGDNVTLNLDPDGRLYLLNSTGFNIKNITDGGHPTKETINMMKLDADGILRLYSQNLTRNGNWSDVWSSTSNKCEPKGSCGLNGYCVMKDKEAECNCLPGFKFVTQGNWTSGCERDFNAESCKDKNGSSTYTMEELSNTEWEDVSYSVLSSTTKDNCKQACLEDCNCEAALFTDGRYCRKQRLPLRFGRRNLGSTNLAIVKVVTPISIMDRKEPITEKKNLGTGRTILIISCSFVAFGLAMVAIFGIIIYRYHVLAYKKVPSNDSTGLNEEFAPRAFTYAELENVTCGFKEEIGRGSFGTVYKGIISSNQKVVAVKRLEKVLAEGEREFQNEMKVIGKTHHRNLVRLLGYCHDEHHRLLVYEYMSNGSLADILFSPEKRPCFPERLEIARNIARGIVYLHEECETQIIHCDIKPQNILIDESRCPKVSDFGLAKLLKSDQTKTFTGIRGTRGYVAPEWHRNMPVTVKADVYSFGVMLLEITCCRKNVDWSLPEDEAVLEQWVYQCFQDGDMDKLVGEEVAEKKQLDRMVKVGIWCTLDEPSLRPSMKKVLLMLEGTVEIPIPPSPTSFFTAI